MDDKKTLIICLLLKIIAIIVLSFSTALVWRRGHYLLGNVNIFFISIDIIMSFYDIKNLKKCLNTKGK